MPIQLVDEKGSPLFLPQAEPTTVTPRGITIVSEQVEHAGAVVWWSLHGDLDLTALAPVWVTAGLSPETLPPPTTPGTALRIAVQGQASKCRIARPLGRNSGWALVDEESAPDGKVLSHDMRRRAFVVGEGQITIERRLGDAWVPGSDDVSASIALAYSRALYLVSGGQVGGWLVDRVRALRGIPLRETGGVYFIPHAQVAAWRTMAGALRQATGHQLYELPALKDEEATRAIMAAMLVEAGKVAEELSAGLADGEFGARRLRNRVDRCAEMAEKLSSYETMLGVEPGEMDAKLLALHASLVEAALVAEAGE